MTTSATARHVVIIGAGHAGVQVAVSLRERKFSGAITLVNGETAVPYQRPPLSKDFLTGAADHVALLRPAHFYEANDIEVVCAQATALDRHARSVALDDGRTITYDHLILATGARDRGLEIAGAGAPGTHALRTLADAEPLRHQIDRVRRIAVIGGGFIGLEAAAAARKSGCEVSVIEAGDRVMSRAVSVVMSRFLTDVHSREGVQIHHGRRPVGIDINESGRACGVELDDGTSIAADIVVTGIGVQPNTALASSAELAVANGVRVDQHLRTTDSAISAIGDCAEFEVNGFYQRLESVQNAVDHARHVAAQLTSGVDTPYCTVPWFWTHQFQSKVQIAGVTDGPTHDVQLGSGDALSILRFDGDTLVTVESVNRPADHLAARRILAGTLRPTIDDVQAPGFTLKAFGKSDSAAQAT